MDKNKRVIDVWCITFASVFVAVICIEYIMYHWRAKRHQTPTILQDNESIYHNYKMFFESNYEMEQQIGNDPIKPWNALQNRSVVEGLERLQQKKIELYKQGITSLHAFDGHNFNELFNRLEFIRKEIAQHERIQKSMMELYSGYFS